MNHIFNRGLPFSLWIATIILCPFLACFGSFWLLRKLMKQSKLSILFVITFGIQRQLAMLQVRLIQYEYKELTKASKYNQSSPNTDRLRFLIMKEWYYRQQFEAWGKFHPSCNWTSKDKKFIEWLFPKKDFEQISHIQQYHPEFIVWYHNKIYNFNPKLRFDYDKESIKWQNRPEGPYYPLN